ncbi:MAG: tetratricopeptide repeat protein, partial [Thermoanaerobaculia bacterium]
AQAIQSLDREEERREVLSRARQIHDTPDLCMEDNFRPLPGSEDATQLAVYRRLASRARRGFWRPHLALSFVEARAGHFDRALRSLQRAREEGGPAFKLLCSQGVMQGMRKDLAGAEQSLRRALAEYTPIFKDKDHDLAEAHFNLGFCLEQQGRHREALPEYRLAQDQGHDWVDCGLAAVRNLRLSGDTAGAVEVAVRVLPRADAERKYRGELRAEIGRAHAAAGRFPECEEWFRRAEEVAPGKYAPELEALRKRLEG